MLFGIFARLVVFLKQVDSDLLRPAQSAVDELGDQPVEMPLRHGWLTSLPI
jgi:hypothetical protein